MMPLMLKPLTLATILLMAGCSPAPRATAPVEVPAGSAPATPTARTRPTRIEIGVYYPDTKNPEYERTCGALSGVRRQLDAAERTPLGLMRVLLEGPTREELARGLQDPFGPATTSGKDEHRLSTYLTGARIEGRRAILSFRSPAMNWLNNTSCIQEAVKMPIERTLREAFAIDRVDYEIEGRIVTEWDA